MTAMEQTAERAPKHESYDLAQLHITLTTDHIDNANN
jgi:hypothetical protein